MGFLDDIFKGVSEFVSNPIGKVGQMTGDFVGGDIGKGIKDVSKIGSYIMNPAALLSDTLSGGLNSLVSNLGSGQGTDLANIDWGGIGNKAWDMANSPVGQQLINKALPGQTGQASNAASTLSGLLSGGGGNGSQSRVFSQYTPPAWTPLISNYRGVNNG